MASKKGSQRALDLIRLLPRISLDNVSGYPRKKPKSRRGGSTGFGCSNKGTNHRLQYARLGFESGQNPFYLMVPMEHYYKGHNSRRQYPPFSLHQLQLTIDTNRIDSSKPIDLTTICNTKCYTVNALRGQFGVNLTIDGVDQFTAKVNVEVQWASEAVIAAIERNGGVITTAYFDIDSVFALADPIAFFRKGEPIPRRMLPPQNAIKYYTDPKVRGYLADPEKIAEERLKLAQKYGYTLPDIEKDPMRDMLLRRKDPRQVFFGLQPGWIVNLADQVVLKPKGKEWEEYYRS